MVELYSKKGFGVTYASGRYEKYAGIKAVLYKMGSDVFFMKWADGQTAEKEVALYSSIRSLENDSFIEF